MICLSEKTETDFGYYEWDQGLTRWRHTTTGDLRLTIEPIMNTETLVEQRGTTHGRFADNAKTGQRLRALFRTSPQWDAMPDEHREALDMIACKVSRILSGYSQFKDHWDDIAGYARLAGEVCRD